MHLSFRASALIASAILFCPSSAIAQTAETPEPPSAQSAPPAAQSGAAAAELPPVEVTSPADPAPQKKKPAKPKATADVIATSSAPPASSAEPTDPLPSDAAPTESATGPVKGYIANRTETGIKTDTPLREVPQSISVVTRDRIEDQASKTIQESVRYVPGVFADAYGPDSRGDYPRVRGSDPDIYLDGTRLIYSFRFNEARPDPYTLERIEVLRGPASVLYGQAAIAGLLNLVSKRPQEEEHREITFEYGSFERMQVKTDMTGKLTEDGRWLYRFVGLGRDSEYQTDFVDDDRIVINPSLTWRPSTATTLTMLATYQKDKTGSSTAFLPQEGTLFAGPNGRVPVNRFLGDPALDKYQTETGSVSALFEHKLSDALTIRQNMRYTHTDGIYRTLYSDSFSNPANPFLDADRRTVARFGYAEENERDNFTSDTNAQVKFSTGPLQHKTLVGYDYRYFNQTSRSAGFDDQRPFDLYDPVYLPVDLPGLTDDPGVVEGQHGVYIQDQIRLGPLIAVLGVRHDRATIDVEGGAENDDRATTRRAGLQYEMPNGLTPYMSYSEAFSPVGGVDFFNRPFTPLEGETKEIGVKYQPSRDILVNAAVFEAFESNRLASDPDNPLNSIQIGEARFRGFELEGIFKATSDLDLIAAYSYTDAIVTKGDNAGVHVETVPDHLASLWAKYSFAVAGVNGFSVGAGVRYIGETWDGADGVKTPDYALYDAMFAYETDVWKFQINGSNLEDKEYVTTCLARGDCFYGTSRTILSSFTYKF